MSSPPALAESNASLDAQDAVDAKPRRAQRRVMVFAFVVAALLLVPIVSVALNLFAPASSAWSHIVSTTLLDLVSNSILLVVFVAAGVAIIGTVTAKLTARFEWRGRVALEWMLVLPLAMPAYVMAYAYTDFLQYAGPLQTWMREFFGWQSKSDYWFFDVRSLGGAAAMLTLVLYPYVYLLARVAFLEQSTSLVDAGRSFGYSRTRLFFKVSLPLARPAIAAGVALATMETLADYGTVSYFGVNTFTTGIFSAWFAQGDHAAAAKLSTILLVFVVVLIVGERIARRRARFGETKSAVARRTPLEGWRAWMALAVCTLPLVLGFVIPVALLIRLAMADASVSTTSADDFAFVSAASSASRIGEFSQLAWNSFSLATLTALIAVAVSLVLAYAARNQARKHGVGDWSIRFANRVAGLGYAIPGTVVAVGVLVPVTLLDHKIADGLSALFNRNIGLVLTGGISVLVYAYLIRFLAISLQTCEAGFAKITPSMDDAARSLGASNGEIMRRVHAPLLKTSLITAGLMVFVDVMKELPATLVMRPFNFDTLAVRTYTLAKDERLAEASIPALVIVLVGLIPVIFASRAVTRER
jgi:iron(III) transport system permease protein